MSRLWRFEKGDVVCAFAEDVGGLWIIANGSLISHRDNLEGRRMIQGIVMPGELYGIAPLFDGKPALTAVSAREPANLVLLPREPLIMLLQENAARLFEFALYFANRTRVDYERAQIGLNNTLRCQLAKYLAYFSGEDFYPLLEGAAFDWEPPIMVTQQEIAGMMGVSRQSISKLMTMMVRHGVLRRRGAQVCVTDYLKLLAFMEEDEPIAADWRDAMLMRHEVLVKHRGEMAEAKAPRQSGPPSQAPKPASRLHLVAGDHPDGGDDGREAPVTAPERGRLGTRARR
jgi:CRP-like cAMP-binding protein